MGSVGVVVLDVFAREPLEENGQRAARIEDEWPGTSQPCAVLPRDRSVLAPDVEGLVGEPREEAG